MQHTSPLEREILTHYWTTPGPYAGSTDDWSQSVCIHVRRFVALGLLEERSPGTAAAHIVANQEALKVYMEALAQVPLPVRQWVIPKEDEP